MIMKPLKLFFSFVEIGLALTLLFYFAFKIISPFLKYGSKIETTGEYIIFNANLNPRQEFFFSLISFDYDEFLSEFRYWNPRKFEDVLSAHSFINTRCDLNEFNTAVLKLGISYWEKGAFKIELKFPGEEKWRDLKNILVDDISDFSLEKLVFLGMGMEPGVSLGAVPYSEEEFIKNYFSRKRFRIKKEFLKKGKVLVRISGHSGEGEEKRKKVKKKTGEM